MIYRSARIDSGRLSKHNDISAAIQAPDVLEVTGIFKITLDKTDAILAVKLQPDCYCIIEKTSVW